MRLIAILLLGGGLACMAFCRLAYLPFQLFAAALVAALLALFEKEA